MIKEVTKKIEFQKIVVDGVEINISHEGGEWYLYICGKKNKIKQHLACINEWTELNK